MSQDRQFKHSFADKPLIRKSFVRREGFRVGSRFKDSAEPLRKSYKPQVSSRPGYTSVRFPGGGYKLHPQRKRYHHRVQRDDTDDESPAYRSRHWMGNERRSRSREDFTKSQSRADEYVQIQGQSETLTIKRRQSTGNDEHETSQVRKYVPLAKHEDRADELKPSFESSFAPRYKSRQELEPSIERLIY